LANAAARAQPSRSGYVNAVQVFPFADGALFQVYAAPADDRPVKITVELPAAAHRDLIAYAEAFAQERGQTVEPVTSLCR
jgi:Protein of unknown function (DUF2274)